MKSLFAGLLLLPLLVACGGGGDNPPAVTDPVSPAEKLVVDGAGSLGIFDPSLARDPASGRVWMSYSSVAPSSYYDPAQYWGVSIRLAYSDDDGQSWQDAGLVPGPNVEAIVGPMSENNPEGDIPAGSQGIWQSEVSSLIHDPAAPASQRWKLIWVQYLNANRVSFFVDHAWLSLKMAASPEALATAPTIKLFGGAGLQADGSNTGAPVYSPLGGMPLIQLNSDITRAVGGADVGELALCIFNEPGLYASDRAVYLAVYCADAATIPATGRVTEYIVSFRCASPCDMTKAASWEYLGRLLTPADAQAATGLHHFQAPALVEKQGKVYLLVTPVDTRTGDRYAGCRIYAFADIDANRLQRDGSGQLVETARIDGVQADSHNGACADLEGLAGGVLLSQFDRAARPDSFRIYQSGSRW